MHNKCVSAAHGRFCRHAKVITRRRNAGKKDTVGEEPQERQRRRKEHKRIKDDKDLNLPRDSRSCVLDNFLLENTKERDGKIQESYAPNLTFLQAHCEVHCAACVYTFLDRDMNTYLMLLLSLCQGPLCHHIERGTVVKCSVHKVYVHYT